MSKRKERTRRTSIRYEVSSEDQKAIRGRAVARVSADIDDAQRILADEPASVSDIVRLAMMIQRERRRLPRNISKRPEAGEPEETAPEGGE